MTTNQCKKIKVSCAQGFTLPETLLAIAILMIAIVGPISLIGDAIHRSYYAKDQVIAINLAQEGIEAVRKVRDSNLLALLAWDASLGVGDYTIDTGSLAGSSAAMVIPCGTCLGLPQPVVIDALGLYRQNVVGGSPTVFSRIVSISTVPLNLNERKVTSLVTWRTGGETGTISVSEYLFKTL